MRKAAGRRLFFSGEGPPGNNEGAPEAEPLRKPPHHQAQTGPQPERQEGIQNSHPPRGK